MTGEPTSGAFDDQGDPERAKRFARMWAWLTLALWGMSAVVSLAWWGAQAEDLAGGPVGGFRGGAMFPWYVVVPGVPAGAYTAVRAVRARARYRTLRRGTPGR